MSWTTESLHCRFCAKEISHQFFYGSKTYEYKTQIDESNPKMIKVSGPGKLIDTTGPYCSSGCMDKHRKAQKDSDE